MAERDRHGVVKRTETAVDRAKTLKAGIEHGAPGLFALFYTANQRSRYLPLGLSLRHGAVGWVAIVRAHDVEDAVAVVAFGGGATPEVALTNAALEVSRGRWSLDRYANNGNDAKKDAKRHT